MQGVFGFPPSSLVSVSREAVQFSPLAPGSAALETAAAGSLAGMVMLAPPGTVERRYTLACALLALAPGASLTVMALNKKGGTRLMDELRHFGCEPLGDGRQHYRICECKRPQVLLNMAEALEAGQLQKVAETGLWSQAGVFSWNKLDTGSALLAEMLPPLAGRGADLGAGVGFLTLAALASPSLSQITLVDVDCRAVEAARRNVADARAQFLWADVREAGLAGLDFVIMNPPFHDAGMEDQPLGQQFVQAAADALRPGGVCYMVANRHLPYEATLKEAFKQVKLLDEAEGFKLFEART